MLVKFERPVPYPMQPFYALADMYAASFNFWLSFMYPVKVTTAIIVPFKKRA